MRTTEEGVEIDFDLLLSIGRGVLIAVILVLVFLAGRSSIDNPSPLGPPVDMSDKQQLVFEHTNYDGSLVTYCDIPSMDRVYVLNNNTMTIIKGGCQGLP